jgi:hypothetical protein
MLGKSYLVLAIGIAALFAGVMYTITLSTGKMVDAQSELLRARIQGEISGEQYTLRSQEAEQSYRQNVSEALEKLASKFEAVAGIIKKITPESNASENVSILSKNLTAAIESFRSGG